MGNFNANNNVASLSKLSGLGSGVGTFLSTPSSANLAAALTDETGFSSGAKSVFNISPEINTSLTTASTTFSLLNSAATTINCFQAATSINIGAAGGNVIFGNARAVLFSSALEVGRTDGVASTPYVDFHAGATATDFDARIVCTTGNGVAGEGDLAINAANLALEVNNISTAKTTINLLNSPITVNAFQAATTLNIGGTSCLTNLKGGLFVGLEPAAEPTTAGLAGTMITWNSSGGLGETDIVNYRQGGIGGFYFKIRNVDGTLLNTPLTIDPSGNVAALGVISGTDISLESSTLPAIKFKETGFNDVAGILFQTSGTGDGNYLALTGSASDVDPSSQTIGFKVTQSGKCLAASRTAGLGYELGASITQTTSKSTSISSDNLSGVITMNNAALAGVTNVSFTFTNTAIAVGDHILLSHVGGGTLGNYLAQGVCNSGSATIAVRNLTSGSLSDAVQLKFTIIKGANS